jgi:exodeoxyribonuclease VII small subunit
VSEQSEQSKEKGSGVSDENQVSVSDLSYMEASRELDAIVEFFEDREVDVDQLVSRLERATALVDELDRRVRRTRTQVEQLVPRLEASARSDDKEDEPSEEE